LSNPPASADDRIEPPPARPLTPARAKPGSRAGRPTAARVEAINNAILKAARERFLAAGFEATPMEAVAASARVSKGTLYSRYPTKEALLRAVVEEQLAAWKAHETLRQGALPTEFRARLQHHARAILDALGSEKMRAFETLVGGAGRPGCGLARALHETAYRMAVESLAEEIVAGAGAAPAPPGNPTAVAETLMAMLYGWYSANEPIRRVTREEARDFADRAVDLLLSGRAAW
jgi:AcrR family transcriptional regulator